MRKVAIAELRLPQLDLESRKWLRRLRDDTEYASACSDICSDNPRCNRRGRGEGGIQHRPTILGGKIASSWLGKQTEIYG